MKISGAHQLPLPPDQAFPLLQDPIALARAIPGCEALEKTGDDEYKLKMKMMLASISGAFDGRVRLADSVPPTSFRMIVEGTGKIGFVKGEGVLTLTPKDSGSEVAFDGDVQIGGTIASVGQRLIDTTARLLIKRFFGKIASPQT